MFLQNCMLFAKFSCLKAKRLHVLKGMLHQGLNVKTVNSFSNFKSVVSNLCRISLYVIGHHRDASN